MGVQLEREYSGAYYVQVLGPLCGTEKITHRERGIVPVQKYVPNRKSSLLLIMYSFKEI